MSGTNLATAYVQIIPTTKGIQGGIEEALGGAGGGSGPGATVGKNFTSGFIKAIKYSAIGVAVGKTFKDAITGGAQLEQSLGGVETLYKDSAETIKTMQEMHGTLLVFLPMTTWSSQLHLPPHYSTQQKGTQRGRLSRLIWQ